MMELRHFVSDGDMRDALRQTENHPYMMPVYYSIRHELMERFPASSIQLFGYPSQKPILWFIIRHNVHVDDQVAIWANPLRNINEEQFNDALEQFSKIYQFDDRIFVLLPSNISDMFIKYYSRNVEFDLVLYPSHFFYMNEKQQKIVSEMKLELPTGYRFDKVNIATDAQIINDTWIHSSEGELGHTTEKLQCMPSALVRHGKEAVSFEMCDPSGFQNHLFTIEQHRGKGLGTAVEMRLCQQCISEQLWPFKCVELYNTSVLKSANESHLWTRLDDLSHNPIAINFIRFSKKNGPSAPAT